MKIVRFFLLAALLPSSVFCAEAPVASVPIPPPERIFATLKPDHPRLLASKEDFARLKTRIPADARLAAWHNALRREAEELLSAPPAKYEIPDGIRLLGVSRKVLRRTYALAMMHRLDGDPRWAARAWKELEAAAAFPDWNPRHFLDTAEMTHAFAVGYDWIYDAWTPEQREHLRKTILEKGIQPAIACQQGRGARNSWPKARHNWNQVCNGGIGMGALALADTDPVPAGGFLSAALESIQLAMATFEPDGAWGEGPGYWNYATMYNVVILAGLDSALGTDFGLSRMSGFSKTGLFPVYAVQTDGGTFNYADASERMHAPPQLFWFARKFQLPACAWLQCERTGSDPEYSPALNLLWFDGCGKNPEAAGLPPDKHFRNSETVFFRDKWTGGRLFAGFKAGDNKVNHGHLDTGTFVFDALGVRWACDLGADNYNLPGYFGGKRWTYYRLRAEGHNTLVLNPGEGPDQEPSAETRMVKFESGRRDAFAVADLTPAYARHAQEVRRGVKLAGRRELLIQDEVRAGQPTDAWWFLHTKTRISLAPDGKTAFLTEGKQRLRARILSPSEAVFTVMDAAPLPSSPQPEKQGVNKNVRKLAIHLPGVVRLQLAVLLTPETGGTFPEKTPAVRPLDRW